MVHPNPHIVSLWDKSWDVLLKRLPMNPSLYCLYKYKVMYIHITYKHHKFSLKIIESTENPKLQTFFVPTLNDKKFEESPFM